MQFVVTAYDGRDPEALSRRQKARPAHIELAQAMQARGALIAGGAILDDQGSMIGSTLYVDFPSREALDSWLEADPYVTGGVWQDITVLPIRLAIRPDVPPVETEPLDMAKIQQLQQLQKSGRPNILKHLLGIYQDKAEGAITVLQEALAENDFARLEFTAHSMKSSAASMGSACLPGLFSKLEGAASAANPEHLGYLFNQVQRENRVFVEALEQFIRQADSGG